MSKHEEIKTMKLYHHLDRIERRLKLAGGGGSPATSPSAVSSSTAATTDALDPELLGTMDCLHFFGDEPLRKIERLIAQAGGAQARVLDIGTGYGGSARLLAHRTGCRVDALELQPDLSAVAQELTARCALGGRVTHLTGDFLRRPVETAAYDVVVGLLCFLHIGQWRELFARCLQSLKPGGVLYVEDFFRRGPRAFSPDETRLLQHDIYCAELITREEMEALLADVGFAPIHWEDATAKWTPYVTARADNYSAALATHIETDGEDTAKALDHFYRSVADVFRMGNLGGYTLAARRPL